MNLYNDLNPEYTIRGTGFKDKAVAIKTIKLVSERSALYQFQTINTLYNRARFHPHKTSDIEEAIEVFRKWLREEYPKLRKQEKQYVYLPLDMINKFESLAEEYGISRVARGLEKSTKSDQGFLVVYRKVKGQAHKLIYVPAKKSQPQKNDWNKLREKFINARLGQMKAKKTKWFYTAGKYKGLPTKQHLVLIMNGYSPHYNQLKTVLRELQKKK